MLEFDDKNAPIGTVIKIIGVGGAGGNAINTMIENGLEGVEFIAANTDVMDLKKSKAKVKLQLGKKATRGLGTGANPSLGRDSALESEDDIRSHLEGADMVFIAAGMGGGTGTGAAPVIASIARQMNILTLGIVTSPFAFEGKRRFQNAEEGENNLRQNVDTLIVIPNEKLKDIYADISLMDAFHKADDVLYQASKAVSDIINLNGFINVDFADVKTVMANMGLALMGIGMATGEDRAINAAKMAISNPLLSDISLEGCQALLINVTAGYDLKMAEYDEIAHVITNETGSTANIIMGLIFDEQQEGHVTVTIIATGLHGESESLAPITQIHTKSTEQANDELSEIFKRIGMVDKDTPSTNNSKPEYTEDNTNYSHSKTDIPTFLREMVD